MSDDKKGRGFFSRSRGLDALLQHFPIDLIAFLSQRRTTVPDVRVLEIGCGEGRLLMELRRKLPDIELHGINKSPWPAMSGRDSFKQTGTFYGIFSEREIEEVTLPFVHFYDATRLGFDDASLDLVVSQKSIHYFERKDTLLEEVWRTLRPGGLALLEVDERRPDMPASFTGDTPRFVLYADGKLLPLAAHLAAIRARGFGIALLHFELAGVRLSAVCMRKNRPEPLPLALDFDPEASGTLEVPGPRQIYWGHRSVYRVRRQPDP